MIVNKGILQNPTRGSTNKNIGLMVCNVLNNLHKDV
jgi:hypothetical protein